MLEALQQHLRTLSDAKLAALYLSTTNDMLAAGSPLVYDPTQDVFNIDNPDEELPSVNEAVALKIMDCCQQELERRAILRGR